MTERKAYCPCCGSSIAMGEVVLDRQQGVVVFGGIPARLSPHQTSVVAELLRAWPNAVSSDALIFAMYSGVDEPQESQKVLHIVICKLRPLLKPLGLSISTIQARGYKLSIPRDGMVNKLSLSRRAA